MRGQAAILEALAGIMVLVSATTAIASISYMSAESHTALNPSFSNAFFDISHLAYRNASMRECALNPGSTCSRLLRVISSVYGFVYVNISSGGKGAGYGNRSACGTSDTECMPIPEGTGYRIACIYECGG